MTKAEINDRAQKTMNELAGELMVEALPTSIKRETVMQEFASILAELDQTRREWFYNSTPEEQKNLLRKAYDDSRPQEQAAA